MTGFVGRSLTCFLLLTGCATGQATGVACRDYPTAPSTGLSIWPWMWPVDLVWMAGEAAARKAAAYRECARETAPTSEAGSAGATAEGAPRGN